MYLHINSPDQKCSSCGAINFTETVNRNYQTFIRCRSCGHEKCTSTTTFGGFGSKSGPVTYKAESLPREVTF